LNQSHPHVEIIVVDDGSPDDVRGALKPYLAQVRLIHQYNQGLSAARNSGLRETNGSYVKFLDADDWLLADCIEHQYNALSRLSKHVCVIGYSRTYDDSDRCPENVYPEFGKMSHQLCYINPGPPHTYLFHAESINRIGGFDTSSRVKGGHEDYDLLCRLSLLGYEFVTIHNIGVGYRQYANSMSTNSEGMRISRSRVWRHFVKCLLTECNPDVEQLVHILGGYAQRLGNADFRYEAMDLLQETYSQLISKQEAFSNASVTSLCLNISSIRKNLHRARNEEESFRHAQTVDILDGLSKVALERMAEGPPLTVSQVSALLRLARSHLWINRSHHFRNRMIKMQKMLKSNMILKGLFQLITIFSYLFGITGVEFRAWKRRSR
jgi:glycosyltransferase involved in cell wall biosynthesis